MQMAEDSSQDFTLCPAGNLKLSNLNTKKVWLIGINNETEGIVLTQPQFIGPPTSAQLCKFSHIFPSKTCFFSESSHCTNQGQHEMSCFSYFAVTMPFITSEINEAKNKVSREASIKLCSLPQAFPSLLKTHFSRGISRATRMLFAKKSMKDSKNTELMTFLLIPFPNVRIYNGRIFMYKPSLF